MVAERRDKSVLDLRGNCSHKAMPSLVNPRHLETAINQREFLWKYITYKTHWSENLILYTYSLVCASNACTAHRTRLGIVLTAKQKMRLNPPTFGAWNEIKSSWNHESWLCWPCSCSWLDVIVLMSMAWLRLVSLLTATVPCNNCSPFRIPWPVRSP